MELDKFRESNMVIGQGDSSFQARSLGDREQHVVVCWKLSIWERIKMLVTGRIWHINATYGHGLSEVAVTVDKPYMPNLSDIKL